jgi:prephenate dehydrogenase
VSSNRVSGQVRIVGAGLLGASIGLALAAKGVDVILNDASKATLRLAIDYGAGRATESGDEPALIVVAVPPDETAHVVADELATWPNALVTDVASVKSGILAELEGAGADVSRYLGSHPMAGRERGGPINARADMFLGRPWVVCAHPESTAAQVRTIEDLALELGAVPVSLSPEEHDRSVALVSHVPQLVASLLASQLGSATDAAVGLTGQGLRDTTRIASSDPELWVQILGANALAVSDVLKAYRHDLDGVITALDNPGAAGARRTIAEAIASGNAGVARLPGKHGSAKHFSTLVVMVVDKPGELARLLTEIGELGVNMEDLRLEHSPGAQFGLAEISVVPEEEKRLVRELEARHWKIAGEQE